MPVAEPVIHDPVRAYDALRESQRNVPKVAEVPKPNTDPLRAFEIDARHMYPELQHWMTYAEADRLIRVDQIALRPTAHRDLNYVIWRETIKADGTNRPAGSQEVAVTALRRLFGLLDPKPAKKA